MKKVLAPFWLGLQLLAPLILTGLTGCAGSRQASGPPPAAAGYAVFHMPGVYENGMATVTAVPEGVRIELLETFKGRFELHGPSGGRLLIRRDEMSYPGLTRTFSGSGISDGRGGAEGTAEIWIRMAGPIRRDHRKGPWFLRPATPAEISEYELRRQRQQERMRRAGMLEE